MVHGTTALMLAAQNGHSDCVRALVDAHADLNAKTDHGTTAATAATLNGFDEIASMLKLAGGK